MFYTWNSHSVVGQLYFNKQINKLIERDQICGYQSQGRGEGELDEGGQKGANFQL